jgi:hypothetical protein
MNRGETARFWLLGVYSEAVGYNTDTRIRFSKRKDPEEREDKDDRWKVEPIRVEKLENNNQEPTASTKSTLSKECFDDINWSICKVTVTSANADKIESDVSFEWDDNGLLLNMDIEGSSTPLPLAYLLQVWKD